MSNDYRNLRKAYDQQVDTGDAIAAWQSFELAHLPKQKKRNKGLWLWLTVLGLLVCAVSLYFVEHQLKQGLAKKIQPETPVMTETNNQRSNNQIAKNPALEHQGALLTEPQGVIEESPKPIEQSPPEGQQDSSPQAYRVGSEISSEPAVHTTRSQNNRARIDEAILDDAKLSVGKNSKSATETTKGNATALTGNGPVSVVAIETAAQRESSRASLVRLPLLDSNWNFTLLPVIERPIAESARPIQLKHKVSSPWGLGVFSGMSAMHHRFITQSLVYSIGGEITYEFIPKCFVGLGASWDRARMRSVVSSTDLRIAGLKFQSLDYRVEEIYNHLELVSLDLSINREIITYNRLQLVSGLGLSQSIGLGQRVEYSLVRESVPEVLTNNNNNRYSYPLNGQLRVGINYFITPLSSFCVRGVYQQTIVSTDLKHPSVFGLDLGFNYRF